jgi:phosphate transport system permease protein
MTTTNLDPSSIPLPTRRRPRFGETGLRVLTAATALLLVAVMVLLVYETARQAWPSIQEFGLGFITSDQWNVVTGQFGALNFIIGTLLTSVVALVIAVPMAIAIGLFLSELAPRMLRTPVGLMVELLAAIPSVVLGLWGILVMGPFLAEHVEPWLSKHLGFIPLFSGYPSSQGILPACVVLSIMVVPIVASISRELFLSVPGDLKQGAMALGATRWEMVRSVMLPYVSGGLVASTMLGFGRAVGEAIAVTQVIGSATGVHVSLFATGDTLAARIASKYQGAPGALEKPSLAYLGLILLVFALLVNVIARWIVKRTTIDESQPSPDGDALLTEAEGLA